MATSVKDLNWNGFADGKFPEMPFVSFELAGTQDDGENVEVVDMNFAEKYSIYGRLPNGEAVALHDCDTLEEADARLALLEASCIAAS